MKPLIVTTQNPRSSFLVDADSMVYVTRNNSKGEEWKCPYFMQAIQILDLRAGEVAICGGDTYPRPAQLTGPAKEWVIEYFPPESRGIHSHAAGILLSMPLIDGKLSPMPRNGIKVGKPALSKGFNDWKFLTAWCWSKWEDDRHVNKEAWSLQGRWLAMKNQLGYPHKESAFRKMCASMKLFVTDSRKHR